MDAPIYERNAKTGKYFLTKLAQFFVIENLEI